MTSHHGKTETTSASIVVFSHIYCRAKGLELRQLNNARLYCALISINRRVSLLSLCVRSWPLDVCGLAAGEDGKTRYQFSEGAVTIKEVINKSFWGVFNTAGLLAEFKVVGTWDAFPIEAFPDMPPSA